MIEIFRGLRDGVFYKGGATDCVEGAYNEFVAAGNKGMIKQIGIHAHFIPPNAKPDNLVGNAGSEYDADGNLITKSFWGPYKVEDILLTPGKDITTAVVRIYSKKSK